MTNMADPCVETKAPEHLEQEPGMLSYQVVGSEAARGAADGVGLDTYL
jgi:hypothetical protein